MPSSGSTTSILREVQEGKRFRCVEYAIVINGCLNSLAIPSRVLGLKTADVETRESGAGYVVAEAFDRDRGLGILTETRTFRKAERFFGWIAKYLYHFDARLDLGMPPQSPGSVMLLPVAVPEPTVFQRRYPITDMAYKRSVTAFYAEPR